MQSLSDMVEFHLTKLMVSHRCRSCIFQLAHLKHSISQFSVTLVEYLRLDTFLKRKGLLLIGLEADRPNNMMLALMQPLLSASYYGS